MPQNAVCQRKQVVLAGQTDNLIDHGFVYVPAVTDALVQNGQCVPQGTVCQPGNQVGRLRS